MCAEAPLAMTILHPFATLAREVCCPDTEVKTQRREGQHSFSRRRRTNSRRSGCPPHTSRYRIGAGIHGHPWGRSPTSLGINEKASRVGFVSRLRASNQNQQAPSQ